MKTFLLLGAAGALALAGAAKAGCSDPLAPIGAPQAPAPAPVKPVTETIWGRQVTDLYRGMESLDPATLAWMRAEGRYTRAVLDAIKPRAELERKIAAFTGSFGFVEGYVSYGGRAFYEERAPGSDNFDLLVRDGAGVRKLVDVGALRAAHGGKPYAINYFLAAPDGSKVAVGVSEGGSEAALISVYDAASGKLIAGPLDRAEFGATTWSNDSRRLYFIRLKQLQPGDPATEKYRDASLVRWDLKSEPIAILGSKAGRGPAFNPDEIPVLGIQPGTRLAIAASINGVQNEQALWLAPEGQVDDPGVRWKPFVSRSDDVTGADSHGDEIFLLSHKNAPTFQVLAVRAGEPLSSAAVLVPAEGDRVIDSVHAAADALYVLARSGAYSHLLRVPYGSGAATEIALPYKGHIGEAFTDPRVAGITVDLESFVVPPAFFSFDPAKGSFADLGLGTHSSYDPSRYLVRDLRARAEDGVEVPVSLITSRSAKGPQVLILEAYGSYGISHLADFSPRMVSFLEAGGSYAYSHVRGGGELGEAWRLGGKDANKFHTWRDLIATAEYLIAEGATTRDKLFILGGSAGGITMGRAMEERPDLFAGVLDLVPAANTLRAEFSPNGPPNIPEFGTIKTEEGFRNLFMMDSIQHVKKGVCYPAIMITTGLNDPRVAPWEPAKMAAALQASGTANPVLLRIDAQAGHGIGSTKTQNDQLYADMYAFAFWRAGVPGWRPGRP